MKAIFGVVSLLLVLAIVGLLASRQMKATTVHVPRAASSPEGVPAMARQQVPEQVQEQVRDELNRALQQGAQRREEAER